MVTAVHGAHLATSARFDLSDPDKEAVLGAALNGFMPLQKHMPHIQHTAAVALKYLVHVLPTANLLHKLWLNVFHYMPLSAKDNAEFTRNLWEATFYRTDTSFLVRLIQHELFSIMPDATQHTFRCIAVATFLTCTTPFSSNPHTTITAITDILGIARTITALPAPEYFEAISHLSPAGVLLFHIISTTAVTKNSHLRATLAAGTHEQSMLSLLASGTTHSTRC